MKIQATIKTTEFMGDHSERCHVAIECEPTDTVEILFEKATRVNGASEFSGNDEIILRRVIEPN